MVDAGKDSKATSSELRKQIMEQTEAMLDVATSPTSVPGDVMVEPETEETEETEQAESKEEETTSEEGETSKEETPPKKETLYKLKVEGKEEEWPLEKVIAFAQQGRYLEREKQRLNEEQRNRPQTQSQQQFPPGFDQAKAKEQFLNNLAENPFETLGMVMTTFSANQEQQKAEERKADRAFERNRKEADPDTWNIIKPIYDQYRDEGNTREQAYLLAENDMLRNALVTAKQRGVKEGVDKTKAKQRAEIPMGQTRVRVKGKTPSPEELKKMPSKEQRKYLPRSDAPGW